MRFNVPEEMYMIRNTNGYLKKPQKIRNPLCKNGPIYICVLVWYKVIDRCNVIRSFIHGFNYFDIVLKLYPSS